MPQVVVDEILVYYTSEGSGPLLLCVHGWMHNVGSFKELTHELKNDFQIVALDLPNFGNSQATEAVISVEDYGNFLAKFVDKLKINDYTVVGHSMGGQILINAIASNTLTPKSLILIASAGIRDNHKFIKSLLKILSKPVGKITPKKLKKKFYKKIGSDYDSDLSSIHKKVIANTLQKDVLAASSHINIPTLLIYGSADSFTPVWIAEKFHEAIRDSKLEVIDGEEHWVHQSKPQEVANLIKNFALKK